MEAADLQELLRLREMCKRKNNQKILDEKILLVKASVKQKEQPKQPAKCSPEVETEADTSGRMRFEVQKYDWSESDDRVRYQPANQECTFSSTPKIWTRSLRMMQ